MEARRFENADDALTYVLGGFGKITIRSKATGTRFTYRFAMPEEDGSGRKRPIFVKLLTSGDNVAGYSYIGCLWSTRFVHGKKSRIGPDAKGVVAFDWVMRQLEAGLLNGELLEIWHEGVCGKCGRTLTVPESIERGMGPVCAKKLAAAA